MTYHAGLPQDVGPPARLLAQAQDAGTAALAGSAEVAEPLRGRPDDPLATVGLALLAYGLVQLLARVVDRLPFGRAAPAAAEGGGGGATAAAGFTSDDRKRLERVLEMAVADHDRVERMQETLREIQEHTRGLSDMRLRVDARDGEPLWRCRVHTVSEQAATNQRLVGQALDEIRTMQAKLDDVLRKLRALWLRTGRRKGDRR